MRLVSIRERARPPPAFPLIRGLDRLSQQSAPGGIRTPNLLIRNQMLYPLSYGRSAASGIPVRNVAKDYRLTLLRRKSASTPDRPAERNRRQTECFNRGGTSLKGRSLGT
jgi:hypothetical protein